MNIKESELDKKYVNKPHKYFEITLYGIIVYVLMLALNQFLYLRMFIFVGMAFLFAFRTIMIWVFDRESETYILSAITCILFILESITYGVTEYVDFI